MRPSKGVELSRLLKEEGANPQVCGVLGLNLISLKLKRHVHDPGNNTDTSSIYCEVSYRNFITRTRPGNHDRTVTIWNQMMFVPVNVVLLRQHPFNKVQLSIYRRQYLIGGRQQTSTVGTVVFHLHDMVKGSPAFGEFPVRQSFRQVGHIRLEVYFTYGSLGFGYSAKLLASAQHAEDLTDTMLPRFLPPSQRANTATRTIVYDPFATLPAFASESASEEARSGVERASADLSTRNPHGKGRTKAPDFPLLKEKMYYLGGLQEKLRSFGSSERLHRLVFLHKQVAESSGGSGHHIQNYLKKSTQPNTGVVNLPKKYFVPVSALAGEDEAQ